MFFHFLAIALCEGYNDCHQICINTSNDGSYYCSCDAGFELAADNRMCTGYCCSNSYANDVANLSLLAIYFFIIKPFKIYVPLFSYTCTALINCTMSPNCSDGCAVINGTETCFCTPGYQLDIDNITCIGMIL